MCAQRSVTKGNKVLSCAGDLKLFDFEFSIRLNRRKTQSQTCQYNRLRTI